tara:strand:- start:329 stop:490 length:162 start_codon:yes stop_codon:yes gene_type:complete
VWPRDVNRQYLFELLSSVLATAAILDHDEAIGPPKTKTQRSLRSKAIAQQILL